MQRLQRFSDIRSEAITEARLRNEAVALVLTHDLLDGSGIDVGTTLWAIDMIDAASRWLDRAQVAA